MANRNPPKSPSVNNLISFWSELDTPSQASPSAPAPVPRRGSLQPTSGSPAPVRVPRRGSLQPPIAGSAAVGVARRPTPNIGSSPALLSSTSSPPSSSAPILAPPPLQRGSAPLFPLRSVAPAQSRVFGAQRHPLDTINARPLSTPLVRPPGHVHPRAPQHSAPQLVSPRPSNNVKGNNPARSQPPRDSNDVAISSDQPVTNLSSPINPTTSTSTEQTPTSARQGHGILKLALIPPVQSKDDHTLKHYQHPARSHPLSAASEPLGTPLDALLPLVKPVSEEKASPAALELDRVSQAANNNITSSSSDNGLQKMQQTRSPSSSPQELSKSRNGGGGARKVTKAPRPASEPALQSPPPQSAMPPNSRRARTSTDSAATQGKGSEIMYAVVKGVPAKPAKPKLVGASGSGTVIVPRNQHRDRSSVRHMSNRTSSTQDLSDTAEGTTVASRIREKNASDQTKRTSLQSFTSSASTLAESTFSDPPDPFDDRDSKENTGLLRKADPTGPMSSNTKNDLKGASTIAESTNVTLNLQVPHHKYAGGTPLGTKRSETSAERSTLDSSDALFQPTAPLIAYPALDAYLLSLKPPKFSEITIPPPPVPKSPSDTRNFSAQSTPHAAKSKKTPVPDPRIGMFPPLHKVPTGVSLDQLKVNVTKPPGFFDQELQNVMLSATMDGIMSAEASNVGISWMRLEIIRDFLQFVALYLSVSGNTFVNQKWLYATVNIIPAILSLDFPRAVGYGMVFLVLFALVCFGALYTFKIMTRTDPNDDIEGLEVSSWSLRSKKQRIETISIVFLLTTLYLPLAKLSFDALVWSDTMWPIANPYKNSDFPVLQPLGPSGIYRDPYDFCYVTSMKIQDLNFAYAIIPLAIFTLCANTFYFPLAIRRLVVQNLPRIDKYTEQGERRLDLDEEYKRLTNSDNCPYNFLYNGYRREYGTYKVIVMFTKLCAVIIVVMFSKDNCLFRNYERRTIEATRAGLQIAFTVSLIYRHYRQQPFLYASQNLSEYWSRACTVATSVIGLFIVLRVGPLSVNALGIMLVATYVLMCFIVIWFVIRQTQKFQVMLKQIQQRLDFSLEIFNPKLNYFKHIKRRIWQETWTTTLLVANDYKMPAEKVVAYSQSPHRPPYLLNFTGTIAERHVENLRIVRQIGLRAYSQACQFLTPAVMAKRTLILKEFVGPDMYYAPEFMASNIKTYFGKAYVVPFPFSVVFVYDESSVVVTLVKEHDLDRYIQQNQDPEIQRRRNLRYQLRALDGKYVVRPFIETRGIQRGRESNGTMEMSLVNAPVSYKRGLFTIHRKKMSNWKGHNMNPGFSVTITYSDGEVQDPEGSSQLLHETTIGHDVIGITRDFQLTPALGRLLRDNHALISREVKKVKKVMQAYQTHYRDEALRKDATLSYDFFINVYDNPTLKKKELEPLLLATEGNPKIRHPPPQVSEAIEFLYERMSAVNRTRCHQWWYLFWDDLYRKNHEEIPQLVPKEFSPAFPGSICYRPMSRPDLEKFLEKHGCWQKNGRAGLLHVGVLNKVYTFLNELVFEKMTREQRQKQLELSTVERQRLEHLFLVTKARVHGDGTYKRMPLLDEYDDDINGDEEKGTATGDASGQNAGDGLGRKPSKSGSLARRKSKKGWFESITPGRLKRQPSRPYIESYSPGYIIPQTWQQKASQFAALLIGGRQEDLIGESDEEDDLEESEHIVVKRRKTSSAGSVDTLAAAEGHQESSHVDRKTNMQSSGSIPATVELQTLPSYESHRPRPPLAKHFDGPGDLDGQGSWRTSSRPGIVLDDESNAELVPLKARQSVDDELPVQQPLGQVPQTQVMVPGRYRNVLDEDEGMESDTPSITSMSSEDYW